ncbi:outer membrane receptor protein [Bernardetia litoralis DSM 6794]|uniref:Outer membrane receptor protein n=1 Tax=Bernardetia litoralis (strain ATCC 23117 / DSM 6794 / NBRC 15988 / NCIMB 1366 / Fx l1 / Sio-4) TaxID=880071 RepID=I4AIG8_BERLS|nr:TonB-dependent receptor [Bernardetia litoralis]AFM03753.1 outer membrane receptor protein [Bernardetia litoralis DSM 6794]
MRNLITSTFKLSLLLLFILSSFSAFAQINSHSITGSAKSDNGEAVSFAAVGLMNVSDSSLAKASVANADGNFRFVDVKNEDYFIIITSVGYQKFTSSTISITENSEKEITLNKFVIQSNNVLDAVEIVAQKPMVEVLADKTVFNVEGTIAASGSSGLELLRKAPGVILDNNNGIIVEGKSGIQVFIDGKRSVLQGEDLTNYLNTLQASDIESIEIITQPSSKYDAAGSAGILNIKLKKNKNFGTNGTVSLGYSVWDNQRYNGSISLNNRTKKTNTFFTYSNRFGETRRFENFYRTQNNFIFDVHSEGLRDEKSHNFKLGTDIFASNKSTFGVLLNGNLGNTDFDNDSRTLISSQSTNEISQVLVAQSLNKSDFYNLIGNLNYRYEDTTGHTLNVDLDYGQYKNDGKTYQPNYYYDGNEQALLSSLIYEMITPTTIDIFTFKTDYEQNFLKGKLGLGIKSSIVNTDNTFDFYDEIDGNKILNTDKSNDFIYQEIVNAVYFNYNRKWKKMNIQFGLRAEHTKSDGKLSSNQTENNERVKRDYLNLFPSGGLTYNANKENSFGLIYSRRIERPSYQNLNPFAQQLDELTSRKGNAFLQPQYIDNIKFSHTYKYSLNTSISYSYINDFFGQVTSAQDERKSVIQTQNIATQQTWSLNISYPFEVNKWWNAFINLNAYNSSYTGKTDDFVSISQSTFNIYGQNTFSLPKGYKFEVSGWYNSPSVWGGTYQTKSLGAMDLAIQKSFLEDKLSFRMSMSDVFFTSPWRGDTQFGDVLIQGSGGWESRQVKINLSYNFGNNKVKSARKRKTGAEDENNRIGG